MNTGGRVLVAVLDLDNGFEAGKVGLLQKRSESGDGGGVADRGPVR